MLGMSCATINFIWLQTNAFVEYVRLFRLGKFLHVDEYKEVSTDDPLLTYQAFLLDRYPNFLVRLVTCPKCLTIWLAMLACSPLLVVSPLVYPLATLTTAYASLYMYFKLSKLMGQ